MGTRNVTIVIQKQEVKIAQYGQWDGYPEGQGITLLSFLSEPSNVEKLKQILPKVRFQNEDDLTKQEEFMKSIGVKNGWMDKDQAEKFKENYPLQHRDVGGAILETLVNDQKSEEIVLVNAYEFAGDSLFCEWVYVVDLDKNSLEVYRGFNTTGITKEDRFYKLHKQENTYYPVKIIQSFSLDDLPDDEEFIRLCKQKI